MRCFIYLLFSILIISCSTDKFEPDEPIEIPKVEREYPSIKVSRKIVNIHDSVTFTHRLPNTFRRDVIDVQEEFTAYWSVNGIKIRKPIIESTKNSLSISLSWSHTFYLPGEYKILIAGNENGKEVIYDSLILVAQHNKDFANYTWKEIYGNNYKDIQGNWSSNDLYHYALSAKVKELNSDYYIELIPFKTSLNLQTECGKGLCSEEKYFLINYVNTIYGKPIYDKEIDGDDKRDVIDFRTLTENNQQEILSVWLTSSTKIALVRYRYLNRDEDYYKIHAERLD